LDLFVRGAFSEYLALAIIPWLWYFLFKFFTKPKNKKVWLGFIIVTSLFILSHNLYLIMFLYFLPLFTILFFKHQSKKSVAGNLFLAAILTLLLTALFWLPLLVRIKDIVVLNQAQKTNFADHFVFLTQLWSSPWGFGGSAPGQEDGMSFALGKINILLFAVGLLGLFFKKEKVKEKFVILMVGLFSLFLSLSASAFLWRRLPFLSIVQFPWRFLGYFSLVMAFGAGGVMIVLKEIIKRFRIKAINLILLFSFSALLLALFFSQIELFQPQMVVCDVEEYFLSLGKIREDIFEDMAEYLPRWVEKKPQSYSDKAFVKQEGKNIEVILNSPFQIDFRVNEVDQEENLIANRFYFPGWKLNDEGNNKVSIAPHILDGKISFMIDKPGLYHLNFTRLPIEKWAFTFSGLALIILFIIAIF